MILNELKARTIRLDVGSDVMTPEEIPSPIWRGGRVMVDVEDGEPPEFSEFGEGAENDRMLEEAEAGEGEGPVGRREMLTSADSD